MKSKYALISVALLVFFCDRILKNYFLFHQSGVIQVLPGWLQYNLEKNFGIAFSIMLPSVLTLVVSVSVVLFLIQWALSAPRAVVFAGILFIIAGAVSNLLDRARFGFVIDYINVPWFTVFNLADISISVGAGLLLIQELRVYKKNNVHA